MTIDEFMSSEDFQEVSEWDEITSEYTRQDLLRELDYQIDILGFNKTDAYPQYLLDKIANKNYKPKTDW